MQPGNVALAKFQRCLLGQLRCHDGHGASRPRLEEMQETQAEMRAEQSAVRAEIKQLQAVLKTILVRTAPGYFCGFCTVEENRGNHFAGRCTRYGSSHRTGIVGHLSLRCLKDQHSDDCGVRCGNCGLDHNSFLCSNRKPQHYHRHPRCDLCRPAPRQGWADRSSCVSSNKTFSVRTACARCLKNHRTPLCGIYRTRYILRCSLRARAGGTYPSEH